MFVCLDLSRLTIPRSSGYKVNVERLSYIMHSMDRVRVLSLAGAIIAICGAGIFGYYWLRQPLIPTSISAQLRYGIFYPGGDPAITVDRSTFKYDRSIGQLSFVAYYRGDRLTFGEQPTPETFYAAAQVYSDLITKMDGYYTFQNQLGTVYLTKDSDLSHEVGVLNAKGTLVFVDSTQNLSASSWREIFNALTYQQGS